MKYFTRKKKDLDYIHRDGAYGLICRDDGQLGVVNIRDFYMFAGGGMEEGESPEETLAREMLEELGARVSIEEHLGDFIEYDQAKTNGKNYELHARVYKVKLIDQKTKPIEEDHHLVWFTPSELFGSMNLDYMNYCVGLLMKEE